MKNAAKSITHPLQEFGERATGGPVRCYAAVSHVVPQRPKTGRKLSLSPRTRVTPSSREREAVVLPH